MTFNSTIPLGQSYCPAVSLYETGSSVEVVKVSEAVPAPVPVSVLVSVSDFSVSGTRYQVAGSRWLVLSTRYQMNCELRRS